MIVCDNVHRDQSSGKYFLLGTFSTIVAAQVPCKHPAMFLFVSVTECRDKTPLTVRLVRVDAHGGDDEPLANVSGEINSPDPLAVHELVMQLRDVTFPKEGEYRFQLVSGDHLLMEKRLLVRLRPKQGG